MGKLIDITGEKFGLLTVLEYKGKTDDRHSLWLCQCDCGNKTIAKGNALKNGKKRSCGCLLMRYWQTVNITHGLNKHPLYKIWVGIKDRCCNPNNKSYKNYGGRGITICDKWRNDFKQFYDDNIAGYRKGLQIDRIDNDKGYFPGNCRWATPKTNARNRGNTIMFEGISISDYCDIHGINHNTVITRICKLGWTVKDALTKEIDKSKRNHVYKRQAT